MATIYETWFPTLGQTAQQSKAFEADTPEQAAEAAARKRCWDDVEWEDHLVAVTATPWSQPMRFEVQVESRPHFTASRTS